MAVTSRERPSFTCGILGLYLEDLAMPAQDALTGAGAGGENPIAPPGSVREQLTRILLSPIFTRAPSLSRFLRHVVEQTLASNANLLSEYSLGLDVFDRGASFDPATDTIVRVQARKLRSKLEQYYAFEGRKDP